MTPEAKAANDELDDLLRRVAPTLDCIDEGEVITSWVLVGHAVMPETEDESRYFLVTSGGILPTHICLGLLRMGQRRVEDDGVEDDPPGEEP